jgi:imidazolonepropionase-like amidohydrolase
MTHGGGIDMQRILGVTWAFLAVGLMGACGVGETEEQSAERTLVLYEGARIIVGDGTTIERGAFLVDQGMFSRVGRGDEIRVPEGVLRVDLSGKTVMPTLIDAHLHLGFEDYMSWGGVNYSRETLIDHLNRLAYYGIGAAFSPGTDPEEFALELQRDQQAGHFGGARFLFAAGMAPPDGGPNPGLLRELELVQAGAKPVRGVADETEARQAVREIAERSIEWIKVWLDDRGGTQPKFEPHMVRAIVDEARQHGIRVVIHHQTLDDMKESARAGVDGYLHGRFTPGYESDEELIRLLRASGGFVIPNLGISERLGPQIYDDPFFQEAVNSEVVDRLRRAYPENSVPAARRQEEVRAGLTRFAAEGIPIVLGTDAGAVQDHFFGFSAHKELEIYVRSGLTPMEAIVAGTRSAAEHLGLEDMGTIAEGKSADFLILDGNPLDDIRNTRTILEVYLRGKEVDRAALRSGWTGED